MSTYAIGDVQGCYDALRRLLDLFRFDPQQDTLWFVGDLVNRGPQSLETLQFIYALGSSAITVLGNHDLALLAIAANVGVPTPSQFTCEAVLSAPESTVLLNWLQQRPLLHYDPTLGYVLVHAGILPQWDLSMSLALAKEVEAALQGTDATELFRHLYGDTPATWDPELTGWDRLRFIVNVLTRMRFCDVHGTLELRTKGSLETPPPGFLPWFQIPNRLTPTDTLLFGHWAALNGRCDTPNVIALDTGCVWGGCLTALRLEDKIRFHVPCQPVE